MGEKYCVLDKLNHLLISNACNLTADQIDHIDSVYHRLRFLAIILKDLEEQQQQQQLNNRLRSQARILKNELNHWLSFFAIRFFDVQVPGQISSGISSDILFKPIEANVVQFYDQIYQIQLLQDFNDGVHSSMSMSMSMEIRTMVDEEITVGFDDEALTIKELLAGGKKQLQMISIVGMPGLGRAKYDASLCSEEAVTDHNNPSILENLRTITSLDPCGHVQDLLARTPFLTKLGIRGCRLSDSRIVMPLSLEFLSHLETLMLDVEFSNLTNLQEVKFPKNVKRLSLKCTKIKWEDISILGVSLPNLELLKLENDAALGWQWATTDDGFPQLKFLKLSRLKVAEWITCSSHFPRLQHLLVDSCMFLEEIPSSLGDILTLQIIEEISPGLLSQSVMIQLLKDEDCLAMASLPCSESNRNGVFKGAIRENVPIRD
ncbi:hypothetical protein LOK49_LG11G00382 [Camellia lanceoleosa]|uniref:Uncharacterized protein n=1 Tax=Camellia lanceoleosa TaxID=1840588 RepID=A0ACC0G108_9ERIC|nr:hypothetical protein LOK49_LG11G00382 [Camellia lanceoleosa]